MLCVFVADPCATIVDVFASSRFSCPEYCSRGIFDYGFVSRSGSVCRLAVGFDLVLVPSLTMFRLEPNSDSDSIMQFVSVVSTALLIYYFSEMALIDSNHSCIYEKSSGLI